MPDHGQQLQGLAQLADQNLTSQGVAERAPELLSTAGEVDTPPDFRAELSNFVDLAVGVKESFGEPQDPTGTLLCLTILVEQVLPAELQRVADDALDQVVCELACLEHQLEAMVGWCVWAPAAVLSDPLQSIRDMQADLQALCAEIEISDYQCLW